MKELDYDLYIARCGLDALHALAEGIAAYAERDYRRGARLCLASSAFSVEAATTLAERWVRRAWPGGDA